MLETNATMKKQRSSKRRNELGIIVSMWIIVTIFFIIGILNNVGSEKNKKEETPTEDIKVEVNMGIAKAFEIYYSSKEESKTKATIEVNKIVTKKMAAPIEETSTETPTEVTTEVTTEAETEVVTEAPMEEAKQTYSDDDLFWLSHVIAAEVGDSTYESKAMCGLVIINRVNSSSFKAETIEDVIFSPGQYETVSNGRIYNDPDDESIEVARKILEGTIEIEIPTDVVYQAEFRQGSGIYCQIGNEYYCFDD